jgi:hypothetical protein
LALQKLARRAAGQAGPAAAHNGQMQTFIELAGACAQHFAEGDTAQGVAALSQMAGLIPVDNLEETVACILAETVHCLAEFGDTRPEFILLMLHTLDLALRQRRP